LLIKETTFYVVKQEIGEFFLDLCAVNPKRTWALLESNSLAIGFMTVNTALKPQSTGAF